MITMADIPFNPLLSPSTLRAQIGFIPSSASAPPCNGLGDANLTQYADQIRASSGGVSGAATLVNALGGASTEYSPVAINGFWADGVSAATPTLTASTSSLPDLSSGGNRSAQNSVGGQSYFSAFTRSIDAVSAVLMSEQLRGEYAYTVDNIIATGWVITMPTKRFYTQSAAIAPYASAWDPATGAACEGIGLSSFDRESTSGDVYECDPVQCGPRPKPALCFATTGLIMGTAALFNGVNAYGFSPIQNFGFAAITAGKEGGRTVLTPSSTSAKLSSSSGQMTKIDAATGAVVVTTGAHTFYGLPMIAVAFTQSSFKTGNPQQNYASGFRLQATRRITTP